MNKGHDNLISDLEALLAEAKDFEFDDFKNNKYAFPKKELVDKLGTIAEQVKSGRYDQ